jgi:nitric oxide reductase subunit C
VHLGLRKLLLGSLVTAFCGQTALVYFDQTADASPALSELAVRGRQIWHQRNCQVCHQIYGFGGFLGPDLTNAAPRLSRERMDQVLTSGNAQMPAFHLAADEIDAIAAYLRELDRTGTGVARQGTALDPTAVMAAIVAWRDTHPGSAAAMAGLATFRSNCTTCHVPFQATALGFMTAPDLTTVVDRLDDAGIQKTILEGRPGRGMQSWNLAPAKVDELVAYFHWLRQERAAIAANLPGVDRPQGLPWWEFK